MSGVAEAEVSATGGGSGGGTPSLSRKGSNASVGSVRLSLPEVRSDTVAGDGGGGSPLTGGRKHDDEFDQPLKSNRYEQAAAMLQSRWRRYTSRRIYIYYRDLVRFCERGDPHQVLRTINPREAGLADVTSGCIVRFRLGGHTFPPNIFYKIFVRKSVVDLCSFAPRDYTVHKQIKDPRFKHTHTKDPFENDTSGWYQRVENNPWRPILHQATTFRDIQSNSQAPLSFACTASVANTQAEAGKTFHHSSAARKEQVAIKMKRRKRDWMKKMYLEGRKSEKERLKGESRSGEDTESTLSFVAEDLSSSGSESSFDSEDMDDDKLLEWSEKLDFEEYSQNWLQIGTTTRADHGMQLSRQIQDVSYMNQVFEATQEALVTKPSNKS